MPAALWPFLNLYILSIIYSMKKLSSLLIPLLFLGSAQAIVLDLNVDINMKALNYNNVYFMNPDDDTSMFFYSQDASLTAALRDISLSRLSNTTMDVALKIRSVGIAGSDGRFKEPFAALSDRYPGDNMVPYIENAYVKVSRLFDMDMQLTLGKQPVFLGNGVALADDGLGFVGGNLLFNSFFTKAVTFELFTYQPYSGSDAPGDGNVNIIGAAFGFKTDGLWKIYSFAEIDNRDSVLFNRDVTSAWRQFTGISYNLQYGFLTFTADAIMQSGKANAQGGDIDYGGNLLLVNGKWMQDIPLLGTGAIRVGLGHASGDKYSTDDKMEAFLPSYGHSFDGIERSGFGDLYASNLYSAFGGNYGSSTGMPDNVSGTNMVNVGITFPEFANIYTQADYYFFEADTSSNSSKSLGWELDIRMIYPIGEDFRLKLSYAMFKPGKAYPENSPTPSRIALEAFARF